MRARTPSGLRASMFPRLQFLCRKSAGDGGGRWSAACAATDGADLATFVLWPDSTACISCQLPQGQGASLRPIFGHFYRCCREDDALVSDAACRSQNSMKRILDFDRGPCRGLPRHRLARIVAAHCTRRTTCGKPRGLADKPSAETNTTCRFSFCWPRSTVLPRPGATPPKLTLPRPQGLPGDDRDLDFGDAQRVDRAAVLGKLAEANRALIAGPWRVGEAGGWRHSPPRRLWRARSAGVHAAGSSATICPHRC